MMPASRSAAAMASVPPRGTTRAVGSASGPGVVGTIQLARAGPPSHSVSATSAAPKHFNARRIAD